MRTSHKLTSLLLSLAALFAFASMALAADPGTPFPASSAVSDQKAGSVLIYNLYSSSLTNPGAENTRINITNTSDGSALVHFFFVDGSNCSVADSFICLTGNQTTTFSMSDTDPGVMGYAVAVAVDINGCPTSFNFLIGDEYVKLVSGHAANLGAEAISALFTGALPGCDLNSVTATLAFNNTVTGYNALPRVLALDHILSRGDGNDTLLILNRIGGSLIDGAFFVGPVFGILYDPLENPASFSFSGGCQVKASLGPNRFPRTTPRFEQFIPTGSYGWMKLYSTLDRALLGAQINFNPNAASNQNAFNGGHNLHKLTLSTAGSYSIPVFHAFCS